MNVVRGCGNEAKVHRQVPRHLGRHLGEGLGACEHHPSDRQPKPLQATVLTMTGIKRDTPWPHLIPQIVKGPRDLKRGLQNGCAAKGACLLYFWRRAGAAYSLAMLAQRLMLLYPTGWLSIWRGARSAESGDLVGRLRETQLALCVLMLAGRMTFRFQASTRQEPPCKIASVPGRMSSPGCATRPVLCSSITCRAWTRPLQPGSGKGGK